MNSPRVIFTAGLTALLLVGCEESPSTTSKLSNTNLRQTVTIHIPQMCDELRLD